MFPFNTGDREGFMNSKFYATLNSKDVQDIPFNVALVTDSQLNMPTLAEVTCILTI